MIHLGELESHELLHRLCIWVGAIITPAGIPGAVTWKGLAPPCEALSISAGIQSAQGLLIQAVKHLPAESFW